mmetsp:Transcript_22239/g.77941  ORF Transcript_22239/g.77941 Transcript_22239/m.77941 type:complete len:119 (-) Transcript_22239:473-829(-)
MALCRAVATSASVCGRLQLAAAKSRCSSGLRCTSAQPLIDSAAVDDVIAATSEVGGNEAVVRLHYALLVRDLSWSTHTRSTKWVVWAGAALSLVCGMGAAAVTTTGASNTRSADDRNV